MQLLIFIRNTRGPDPDFLSDLMEHGIHGATVVDCEGMLHAFMDISNVEPPSIFGSLRQFAGPGKVEGKLLLIALEDDKVQLAKDIIKTHTGPLGKPDSGILFTVPISSFEGAIRN